MTFRRWNPAVDRCVHPRCGQPDAACFHWPDVLIDREPARLNNERLGLAQPAPAPKRVTPPTPTTPVRMADVDALTLSPSVPQRPARSRRRK
jgi:hypothetical protein